MVLYLRVRGILGDLEVFNKGNNHGKGNPVNLTGHKQLIGRGINERVSCWTHRVLCKT